MSTIVSNHNRTIVDKTTQSYYISYRRNLLAVGAMWAVFVVCLAIINVVVVAQPQWLGDTTSSPGVGFFGLIRYCQLYQTGGSLVCDGRMDDFSTILGDAFRAATVFSGLAALLALVTIVLMILFFFVHSPEWVFRACGIVLAVTCLFSLLGCVIFPSGWDHPKVRSVCGSAADKYSPGNCAIRWAFVLAILSIFDSLVLAILAFVLASRLARLRPLGSAAAAAVAGSVGGGFHGNLGNGEKFSRMQSEVNSAYAEEIDHPVIAASFPRLGAASLIDYMADDSYTEASYATAGAKSMGKSRNFQL